MKSLCFAGCRIEASKFLIPIVDFNARTPNVISQGTPVHRNEVVLTTRRNHFSGKITGIVVDCFIDCVVEIS